MPKLNKEWHLAHKMPKNATYEQRLTWHAEHMENCDCRKPPAEMLAEMKKRKLI